MNNTQISVGQPSSSHEVFEYVISLIEYFDQPTPSCDDSIDAPHCGQLAESDTSTDEFSDCDTSVESYCSSSRLGFQLASSTEEALELFARTQGFLSPARYIEYLSEADLLCMDLAASKAEICEYDDAEAHARLEAEFAHFIEQQRLSAFRPPYP